MTKGFLQVAGFDYLETLSSMVKFGSMRIILTIALSFKWYNDQLDINNAFLNRIITKVVYIRNVDGFINDDHSDYVFKLKKLLWLKASPLSLV